MIVKKITLPPVSREDLNEQIPLEAEQHIPFKRDEVDLDYQVLTPKNAKGQMEVILVAVKKEMIADYPAGDPRRQAAAGRDGCGGLLSAERLPGRLRSAGQRRVRWR